jgi:cysteine-rich CPCC protein
MRPVCWWEDDGQDEHNAEEVRGGPNGTLSLSQAQKNFEKYGASEASEEMFVSRYPTKFELSRGVTLVVPELSATEARQLFHRILVPKLERRGRAAAFSTTFLENVFRRVS